jgi:NIMA (never in mitosis gene a)-related kinase
MEYANDGDLSKKIKTQKQKTYGDKYFSEEKILQYFDQICRGLQYIHSKNIIHRDIKTQNIFLMKNGKVKIGDFGISKALTNTKNNASTIIGTPYYFSPEIINGEPYNYKTDIWSLGVVLYEMCCLKLPFESNNIAQLSIKILRGKYDPIPNRYSKNMANLIKQMLNIDQKLRPSIFEVIQSPLLKNYHINKNSNKSYKNLIKNKKYILNSNEPQLNYKQSELILDQRQNERKSDVNKHKYKEKSCSPIKFKNKSYVGKLIKKNNDHSDSPFELPKASNKKKSKKSNIFKRISTQNNMIQNINEDFMISKINKVNSSNNISNNLYNNNNFNIIKSQNHIFKSNNNINNNIINKNINIKSTNNIINTNINRIDIKQNLNVNKSSSNNLQNKNIFYNDILTNKEEIINRSNEFDINFSGKSMLFDKEKTIHLINEEKDKNLIKDNNGKEKLENGNKPFNENIIQNNYINESLYNFNFDEQSIKMFTLKEEEEEETIKSNGTLYNNTDIDNLNFEIKKNENKEIENEKIIQDNNERNTKKNEKINNISKEDLNFEIINNPIIQENHIKKEKKFHLEDYIKQQIGEKMYLIIKQNWLDFNIEQIVNYNYDTIINKLRDVLKKNEFREREIKKAEMYMFDVFFNLINKPKL